jgi:hypothetical protein
MFDSSILILILSPVLAYWLFRKPHVSRDILSDYIVPRGVDLESCTTHWATPAGVAWCDRSLLTEIKCHPDYVERDVPACWFQWHPKDARRRAREQMVPRATGVLPMRKQA